MYDPDRIEYRAFGADDDVAALMDIGEQGFGLPTTPLEHREQPRQQPQEGPPASGSRDDLVLAAFDEGRPVGAASLYGITQWWCGAAVPVGAISGVVVAPEYRGLGVGRRLFARTEQEGAARGYPLLAGCPTVPQFFRPFGWEIAGRRFQAEIPARSLRSIVAPKVRLRRARPQDTDVVRALIAGIHEEQRDSGPVLFQADVTRAVLTTRGLYNYLAEDGFLSYHWNGTDEIVVQRLVGRSEATLRAMWATVATHATQARTVRAWVGPNDPITWLLDDVDTRLTTEQSWMVRVADVPAAITARGFPESVRIRAPLLIEDAGMPVNSGRWLLTVTDGKGRLERDEGPYRTDALTLDARGVVALYAGIPLTVLRRTGMASGGTPSLDAELNLAFTAQTFTLDTW